MLERTFIHLPTIGPQTEQRLWQSGIACWQDFLAAEAVGGLSRPRLAQLKRHVEDSQRCLGELDSRYFARLLPAGEHWRAYPDFRRQVGFLDIETTGLGWPHQVTVVGLYDGLRTRTFVAGDNLDEFPEAVAEYAVLVTYNGASFDLPFLQRQFSGLRFDQLHVDLRWALRRLGLRGGLKRIETRLGIARDERIRDLDGFDAVRLWQEYQAGSDDSLALLIEYNSADVRHLEWLMEYAYRELGARLRVAGEVRARP